MLVRCSSMSTAATRRRAQYVRSSASSACRGGPGPEMQPPMPRLASPMPSTTAGRVKGAMEKVIHPRRHGAAADTAGEYDTVGATSYAGDTATGAAGGYAGDTTSAAGGYAAGDGAVERPVGVGVAEVPVVVTEQERVGAGAGARGAGEEVCGVKTFTEVEDRPVMKERVERVLEHRPVQKEYEVETRFVGETPLPSAAGATVIGATERVVEAAEPGPRCPASAGVMMDEAAGRRL
ncbi:hypothetical protein HT031_003390 [Scenedesmus sp. PABB004]|nr:hypothetical protein HT031_003390 [Scenedesmus sp. PABB004]